MSRYLAAAAWLLLTPLPAAAMDADHSALVRSLERAGVRINWLSPRCADPVLRGYYEPALRTIAICDRPSRSWLQLQYTLRHEAIHAAQDCNSRQLLVPPSRIAAIAEPQDRHVLRLYPPAQWGAELEARVLSRAGPISIANMIDRVC